MSSCSYLGDMGQSVPLKIGLPIICGERKKTQSFKFIGLKLQMVSTGPQDVIVFF